MSERRGGAALPATLPIFPLTGVLLLPRGRLPLNIFEPRYLAMTRDALAGERLIGMVQPSDPAVSGSNPPVYPTGCAGRITSFSETDDGRFLITLTGTSRFRIREELPLLEGYRRVVPDWGEFVRDLGNEDEPGFDRERLMRGLKGYFQQHQISADWDAITSVSGERLVTSIAMICPFDPSEKQALLEAPDLAERARLLTAIVEMAVMQPGARVPALATELFGPTSEIGMEGTPEIDPKLLEILVCPLTKGPLRYDRAAQELISEEAGLAYPIRDGIPIMLVEEARTLRDDETATKRLPSP